MGQKRDLLPSSLDGSYSNDASSASGEDLVIPSPNIPSSVSPKLGGQIVQPAIEFDDDGPGDLLSSSSEEEDESPRYSIYGQREREEREAFHASREARLAAITARRRMCLRLDSDSEEEEEDQSSSTLHFRAQRSMFMLIYARN